MWKNKTTDTNAFLQAIYPFLKTYKIKRTAIREYNNRGRVNNTTFKDTIKCCIMPGGKRINTDNQGKGRWVSADYTVYCVSPEYVSIGDIIYDKVYGNLKVQSLNDNRYQGVMSASLTRTGTTDPSSAYSNTPYEPE